MIRMVLYSSVVILIVGSLLFSWALYVFVDIQDQREFDTSTSHKPVILIKKDGRVSSVVIRDDVKPTVKNIVKKIAQRIYHEATIHNPAGDVLPDTLDDAIKSELRERVN